MFAALWPGCHVHAIPIAATRPVARSMSSAPATSAAPGPAWQGSRADRANADPAPATAARGTIGGALSVASYLYDR
jgi:hypothetical protein